MTNPTACRGPLVLRGWPRAFFPILILLNSIVYPEFVVLDLFFEASFYCCSYVMKLSPGLGHDPQWGWR